jgi:hypothetical protein
VTHPSTLMSIISPESPDTGDKFVTLIASGIRIHGIDCGTHKSRRGKRKIRRPRSSGSARKLCQALTILLHRSRRRLLEPVTDNVSNVQWI